MDKQAVKTLQYRLRKVLNISLSVDGDYGPSTTQAVLKFQQIHGLQLDGIAGPQTLARLHLVYIRTVQANSNLLHFGSRRFVIFVDAGHGGINDQGRYATPGKRAYHQDLILHERGHYYEGFENRLAAEAFIEACTKKGIQCIRTYHPHKDWSLSERTELVRSYLRRGYYGYLHSFHSNAISSKNSIQKLKKTIGYMVFSTLGNTFSDQIAQQHFTHVQQAVGTNNWHYREQLKDGDSDYEVNFQVLRETDLFEFTDFFGAILDEWGFHSSSQDALLLPIQILDSNGFKLV
ncbi:peptidoglycan-binding protein [Aureispira sp. CCB-QB1]|uniref:peptidoglycan-binding protein n=1 Tax=Aureispira sp. CCB-QB1 TaxID=1313421 RepID=UPI0006970AF9|nr:peptidoglycan-binding protein [Aureispira sp. CCB-QB1]